MIPKKYFFAIFLVGIVFLPLLTYAAPFPFNILASIYDQLRQRALELVGMLEKEAKEEGIPFVPSQPAPSSSGTSLTPGSSSKGGPSPQQDESTTGTQPSSPLQVSSCPSFNYIFTQFLQLGSQGCDVAELQSALATDASLYPEKTISSIFDAPTENAVKTFQTRHAIVSSGECLTTSFGCVGGKTRAKLNEVFGGEGASVAATSGTVSTAGVPTGGWTFSALQQRKSRMLSLAKTNPSQFLNEVMSSSERVALPSDLKALVEFSVDLTTKIDVLHEDDFKNFIAKYFYFLRQGKERLQFYPDGELPPLRSGTTVRVKGYQFENSVVASITAQNFQVVAPAAAPVSTGTQNMAVLLLNFLDSPAEPFTKEQAESLIFTGAIEGYPNQMQKFYQEQSYGKVSWDGDVYGWRTLQREGDPGGDCIYSDISEKEIQDFITENNINPSNYQHFALVNYHPCMSISSAGGTREVWINDIPYQLSILQIGAMNYENPFGDHPFSWTSLDYALAHEAGHALSLNHAEGWDCGAGKIFGGNECKEIGYGNVYDTMGAPVNALHFNAAYKEILNWLDADKLLTITSSGRYALIPYEKSGAGFQAAKIQLSNSSDFPFYLEYRQPIGFDANLSESSLVSNTTGLFVNWKTDIGTTIGVVTSTYLSNLLDFSPQSTDDWWGGSDWNQVTLNVGQQFVDEGSGITIGPIISADDSGIIFDVTLGAGTCIRNLPYSSPSEWVINANETKFLGNSFYNADSLACGSSAFKITLVAPENWSATINGEDVFTLVPGASILTGYLITAPKDVFPGEYTVMVNVENLTNSETGIFSVLKFIVPSSASKTFVLTPSSSVIQVGTTQTFEGRYDSDGPDGPVAETVVDSALVSWKTSDLNVTTIEGPGMFIGVAPGAVSIEGFYGLAGITATAQLTVTEEPPPPPTPEDKSTFVVVPDVSTIKVGESVTLEGKYDPDGPDGTLPEETVSGTNMSWTVPFVDGKELVTMTGGGTFKGIAAGTVEVSGTVVTGGIGEGRTASATINVIEELVITTTSLPEGIAGTYYSVALEAKGGLPASGDIPYHWELSSGTLPPIVAFDLIQGKLYGTILPEIKGTYDIVVTVIDDTGTRVSQPLTLIVRRFGYDTSKEDIIITTEVLPDAQLNQYYETYFVAKGGDSSSYYWYYAGRLPGGITFFHNEGKYAGLPLETGIFKFTLQVSDAQGHIDTQNVSITVRPLVPSSAIVPGNATAKIGEALQLAAVYDADGAGPDTERALATHESTWQTSDPAVAMVEQGLVRGFKPGSVTITSTYNNLSVQTSFTVEQKFFDCRWGATRQRASGSCTGTESCTIFGEWSGNAENLQCPPPEEPLPPPPEPEPRFFDCRLGDTRPCAANTCQGTESCTILRQWGGTCQNLQCPDEEEKRQRDRERERQEQERDRLRGEEQKRERERIEREERERQRTPQSLPQLPSPPSLPQQEQRVLPLPSPQPPSNKRRNALPLPASSQGGPFADLLRFFVDY